MDGPATPERRILPRHPGNTLGPFRMQVETLGLSVPVNIWDVSIQGIGILSDREVQPGTAFVIEAQSRTTSPPTELTGQVRHATQRPDGTWLLGSRFARLLTTDDMASL
jgi:hypothetical protein